MTRLALTLLTLAACEAPVMLEHPQVTTTLGPVEGRAVSGASAFLGIPYAEPPVGELRWRPPVRALPWDGTLIADGFAEACIQPTADGVRGSEDCLYLNVWTPDVDASLPVLVWIHGGYLVIGGTDVDGIDGALLAARGDVVVVSIQYRLGALGQMAHPSLSDAGYEGAGNYGFLDQYEALRWVEREIAAFGGDPGNVTIAGESAGGTSVCTAVMSPLAAGLFDRAIIESQACPTRPRAVAEARGQELAERLGCADAACLRALDADAIVRAQPDPLDTTDPTLYPTSYYPVIDGYLLPDSPDAILAARAHNAVPVISMSDAEDAFLWLDLWTWENLDALGAALGMDAAQRAAVAAYYQDTYSVARGFSDGYDRGMLATDLFVICPETRLLRRLAAAQDAPVRRLLFDFAPVGYYKEHGVEILYLFQNTQNPPYSFIAYRESDRFAERTMLDLWTELARTGEPPASVTWPRFAPAAEEYLVLGDGETHTSALLHDEGCRQFGALFE